MRVTTGTDHRWKMTTTMTARHSRAVTSRGTEHSLHESATCHKTDQFRWQQGGELEAYSYADWGGKNTLLSVSGRMIMRGGHCLKVWTKKQQVVSLSTAESELYAAVKTASEGLGIHSVAKDLVKSSGLSNDVLGQPQRTGQGEARRHAVYMDTGGIQVRKVRHEESRHECEPSRPNHETAAETEN